MPLGERGTLDLPLKLKGEEGRRKEKEEERGRRRKEGRRRGEGGERGEGGAEGPPGEKSAQGLPRCLFQRSFFTHHSCFLIFSVFPSWTIPDNYAAIASQHRPNISESKQTQGYFSVNA